MNITGGKFNSRKVSAPESDLVRPTLSKVREGVFNMLSALVDFKKSSFLDAFSGSGIISLEAVSRGFKNVIAIEKNYKTAKIIKQNYLLLGIEPNLIIKNTVFVLDNLQEKFNVIYIDPPYNEVELYNKTLQKIDDNELLSENGVIVVESRVNTEYEVPHRFSIIKEKIYGDTNIKIFK